MSDKLMETEKGGEQTQYESINTVNKPHSKTGGQLSDLETSTKTSTTPSSARADQTAENIRYGQAMSEEGVGGFTAGVDGEADATEGGQKQMRREQGYDAGHEMDRNVGA
ncbi:hypothetical protein K402DRAFT_127302 [Aulographum hederae CBS 113979]|uniref:Uncharacterized protein n=1 Tax=Aulographum hederae CBS 113979 TaxID=1176131 RepID=A0A6G1HE72_9PEZI|nr:hypothetical protein K402DRAFT_127302 [Aulographum hederae CBS 113979]